MKKIIILVVCIVLIVLIGILLFNKNIENVKNVENDLDIYEKDNNIEDEMSTQKIMTGMIENINIQGVVELNRNGYIYTFNGQHFGEYGFEMQEYACVSIDNKKQKCIDYYTLQKYDTTYIEEGDIIFCTGNLKKYSGLDDEFDTKDNPIIVLKANDYNIVKKETLNSEKIAIIGEYNDMASEIYIKYDIYDKEYNLPFVLKLNMAEDMQIIGNLEKGKKIKVQYKDLNVPLDKLKLRSIEVID